MLLIGCAPELLEVSPASGSALGGERVTLTGDRLPRDAAVFFGEQEATVLSQDGRDHITVTLPPGLAGTVAVTVAGQRRTAAAAAAFTYLPLEVGFVEAAAHYLPEPAGPYRAAAAADSDGDGLAEIALLGEDGVLSLWRGTGQGAFVADTPPETPTPAGIAWLGPDGAARLFACYDSGEAARLLSADGAGDALPPIDDTACTGARALDLDGDGIDDIAELRADGVRVWRGTGDGLARWSLAGEDADSCGTVWGEGSCTVSDGVARLEGRGALLLTVPLPDTLREDDGLTLTLRGGPITLTVASQDGSASWTVPGTGGAWETVTTPPLQLWLGDPLPSPPLTSLTLSLDATAAPLELDHASLRLADGGAVLISDFTRWPVELELTDSRDVLAVAGGAVVATDSALVLFDVDAQGSRPAAESRLPDPGCQIGGLGGPDLDGDGLAELYVACTDGQDRLYRTDGQGRWFDDTAATMPTDSADGRGVAAADLDLDGLDEVVVASFDGVARLYHPEGGRLQDWTPRLSLTPSSDIGAIATDIDGDGDLDLLLVQGAEQPSRLFVQIQ